MSNSVIIKFKLLSDLISKTIKGQIPDFLLNKLNDLEIKYQDLEKKNQNPPLYNHQKQWGRMNSLNTSTEEEFIKRMRGIIEEINKDSHHTKNGNEDTSNTRAICKLDLEIKKTTR